MGQMGKANSKILCEFYFSAYPLSTVHDKTGSLEGASKLIFLPMELFRHDATKHNLDTLHYIVKTVRECMRYARHKTDLKPYNMHTYIECAHTNI